VLLVVTELRLLLLLHTLGLEVTFAVHPAVAANSFVRILLRDVGGLLEFKLEFQGLADQLVQSLIVKDVELGNSV